MAKHQGFTVATDVQVYFCDLQSPWQRGTNENTESAVAAILPAKNRPVCLFASATRPGRAALEINAPEKP